MSQWRVMAVALTALMAMLPGARAEDYPTRNVTILVPFAPGGGTDLLARAYAQVLEKEYGKTFVVENRPGGGTTIAATATANATPDGYTLMQGTSGTMAWPGQWVSSHPGHGGADAQSGAYWARSRLTSLGSASPAMSALKCGVC